VSDPLQHGSEPHAAPLFTSSTSSLAGAAAARGANGRRAQILAAIEEHGPQSIFEVADRMGVFDHQISGRFSALEADGFLRKTGERRRKLDTHCDAEVYDLVRDRPRPPDVAGALGYPPTLVIDDELFDRQELLPRESYPGLPYARRTDKGGLRLNVRVEVIECPGCARPLKPVKSDDPKKRLLRCGSPNCKTWRAAFVREPGGLQQLALIMDTM
jgi:DNA-binding Lrp family transcriptional regulator